MPPPAAQEHAGASHNSAVIATIVSSCAVTSSPTMNPIGSVRARAFGFACQARAFCATAA
ncbi:MAG: hypothetical protein A3H96_07050 [Acidobacteria bacterium RIFCSPLOWO2_02_FULL_67_36]|nr:MAG: hypothetical protein A3H96_07050 [Acidobacteria bacterium RIFCSPLOWO2_02_FULL_67_36]OFW26517.1 MAG: hypothetical protein A3G21_24270 [Acidobacteria bacterium RIFCSPLOWO2_12_FULL_66_21]